MDFVFWQNALSIHQSAFLRNLAASHSVLLVVEKKKNSTRSTQGWYAPDFGQVTIKVAPSKLEILQILVENKNAFHVFSGFFSIPMVRLAIKAAVKYKMRIGVILEPFNKMGIKGKLRFIRYLIFVRQNGNKIQALFPTGTKACSLYFSFGFPKEKIFEWAYFTEHPSCKLSNKSSEPVISELVSVLYIGQIIHRKNILHLVEVMKTLKGEYQKFTIIGTGNQDAKLKKIIAGYPEIQFQGSLPNEKVKEFLSSHDLLILPSTFDGWGAVVNEALQAGTMVIASENCGASSLLDGEIRGEVFSFEAEKQLEPILKKWMKRGKLSIVQRDVIKEWSRQNISGVAAARYFVEIINYITVKTDLRPEAPWIKSKCRI